MVRSGFSSGVGPWSRRFSLSEGNLLRLRTMVDFRPWSPAGQATIRAAILPLLALLIFLVHVENDYHFLSRVKSVGVGLEQQFSHRGSFGTEHTITGPSTLQESQAVPSTQDRTEGPGSGLANSQGNDSRARRRTEDDADFQQRPSHQLSQASGPLLVPQKQDEATANTAAASTATTTDTTATDISPAKTSLPRDTVLPTSTSLPQVNSLPTDPSFLLSTDDSLPTKAGSVAICLAGGLRRFELTAWGLVHHLFASYPGADVFVSAPLTEHSHKLLLLRTAEAVSSAAAAASSTPPKPWSLKRVRFLAQEPVDELEDFHKVLSAGWSPNGLQGLLQYFQLVEGCSPLIAAQEQEQGFKYDWVARARPDSYWIGPAPALDTLNPAAYSYPPGSRYRGLNDRFGMGKRRVAEGGLKRLSVLRGLAKEPPTRLKHNSERSLRAQLQYLGIPFQALLPLPFCTLSLRPSSSSQGPNFVPMFGLSSTAPVSGAKCRPCTPTHSGLEALSLLQKCSPDHSLPYDPPPPPLGATGFDLCNSSQKWVDGWEGLYDQQAGQGAASVRSLWASLSDADCVSRLRGVLGSVPAYAGPDADILCRMRPLGPVLTALSSTKVTLASAKQAFAAVVGGAAQTPGQGVSVGTWGEDGLRLAGLVGEDVRSCGSCPALVHLAASQGDTAARKEGLAAEMRRKGWVLMKCGGKHAAQICLFLPSGRPKSL